MSTRLQRRSRKPNLFCPGHSPVHLSVRSVWAALGAIGHRSMRRRQRAVDASPHASARRLPCFEQPLCPDHRRGAHARVCPTAAADRVCDSERSRSSLDYAPHRKTCRTRRGPRARRRWLARIRAPQLQVASRIEYRSSSSSDPCQCTCATISCELDGKRSYVLLARERQFLTRRSLARRCSSSSAT